MEKEYILGLDVSTKTIGISLFEDLGEFGKLNILTHVTPIIKPQPEEKIEELIEKAKVFESQFLNKYKDLNIKTVIIEEPLLRSNNVNTVGTLLKYNAIISKCIYDTLGVAPKYISTYNSRAFAFPELLAIRNVNKKGEVVPESKLKNAKPTLFGAYSTDVDKKVVIQKLVSDLYPTISWIYNKTLKLKPENYDMADSITCVLGYQKMNKLWK